MKRLAAAATALLAMLVACEKKSPPTTTLEASAPPADAAVITLPDALAPGCRAVVEGGTPVDGMQAPGTVTVAIAKGHALLVNTRFTEPRGDVAETASAWRVELSAITGAIESKPTVVTALHTSDEPACCALTWAVATSFGGEPAALSLAATRAGAKTCAGGTIAVQGRDATKGLATGQCNFSTAFAGAAHGETAIGVLDGIVDPTKGSVPAVDAVVHAAGKSTAVRLESFPTPGTATTERPKVDALAAAASAGVAAAAYRVTRGAVQEIHVVRLGLDGKPAGKVEVIDRGVVGAPALAFDGDTLHIVWAARGDTREPYVLRWTTWAAGAAPLANQKLGTGVRSAYAPALAIERGRFLLAWAEGDTTGVVKAGASDHGLAGALALAAAVSTPGVDAKSPAVAIDHDGMFVVWQSGNAELRASPLACP